MKHKKPTGDSPEARQQILDSMSKKLKTQLRPIEPSDLELLIERAKCISREVNLLWQPIDQAVRASGNVHDPKAVAATISKFYLDRFVHWSKDDLLMLLVLMHTEAVVSEIV